MTMIVTNDLHVVSNVSVDALDIADTVAQNATIAPIASAKNV